VRSSRACATADFGEMSSERFGVVEILAQTFIGLPPADIDGRPQRFQFRRTNALRLFDEPQALAEDFAGALEPAVIDGLIDHFVLPRRDDDVSRGRCEPPRLVGRLWHRRSL
jgi:hypothetical protein